MGEDKGVLAMKLPTGRLVRDFVHKMDYNIAADGSCKSKPLSPDDDTAALFMNATKIADVMFGFGAGGLKMDHYMIPVPGVGNSYIGVSAGAVNYPVYFRDARTPDDMILYYNMTMGVSNPDMWKVPDDCPPMSA